METILVKSLNTHRNNLQAAELMTVALGEMGYNVVDTIDSTYTKAIVWGNNKSYIDNIMLKCEDVYYMHVDTDIEVPKQHCINIISQFYDDEHFYHMNIAGLAVFHTLWELPILIDSKIGTIYGGTYKDRRDYSVLGDMDNLVIIGDDDKWNNIPSVRVGTIRDLDAYYTYISVFSETVIPYDPIYGHTPTTRLYECVFTNINCIVWGELTYTRYTPEQIKSSISKEDIKKQIKNILGDGTMNHETTNTKDILKQRGALYGTYTDGVHARATIVDALDKVHMSTHNGEHLPDDLRIMYGDIALKLMRSASNPDHHDSWVDLEGYSHLIKQSIVDGD